jgi:hypothetical protein
VCALVVLRCSTFRKKMRSPLSITFYLLSAFASSNLLPRNASSGYACS